MLGISTRVLVIAGIVVAALVALSWGISQYGKARVAESKVEVVQKATERAQEAFKADLKADAQTRAKRRATLDSVRSSGIPVEKRIEEKPVPDRAVCADPVFDRLLNDTIRSGNAAISAARGVPE